MLTATGLKRSELGNNGHKLVRHDGKQVLVIARNGRVFAIANRCPHEGYPLSEGTIGPGCVLTCNWHNWKFDLASGRALVGRDPVRTYEVAERGGEIFIDFRDPPADERRARALRGIEAAILCRGGKRGRRDRPYPRRSRTRPALCATARRDRRGGPHSLRLVRSLRDLHLKSRSADREAGREGRRADSPRADSHAGACET